MVLDVPGRTRRVRMARWLTHLTPLVGLALLLILTGQNAWQGVAALAAAGTLAVWRYGQWWCRTEEARLRQDSIWLCDRCGYDLSATLSGRCPECGSHGEE